MTTLDKDQGESRQPREDRFRLLFDGAADALFLHDLDGRFVEVNQAACDSLGYTREELLQLPLSAIEKALGPEGLIERSAQILRGEKFTVQGLHRRQDGTIFPVEVHLCPFEYAGRPHILASARDITERLRAEEALRTSESFLNSIIDQSPYPMWISDDRGALIRLNQACRDLLHLADAEVVGKYNIFQDNIIEEQGLLPLVKRVFEEGKTVRFEIKYASSQLKHLQLQHAAFVILHVTMFPIRDASGRITNAVIQHLDITERKRAEAALAESEQRFSVFMAHLPAAVFIKDQEGRLLFANRYLRETFGWEDCVGKTTGELLPREVAALMIEDDRRVLTSGPMAIQERITDIHGAEHFFDTYKFPVMAEGAPVLLGGIAVDVTERKRAIEALELSEKKYRSFYESILDGFVSVDLAGHILETNQSYLEMLGYTAEEIQGLRFQDITPAKWHKFEADIIEQQILTRGYSDTYEKEYIHKDGTVFPVELRTYLIKDKAGAAAAMWAFVRDITERKRAEEALQESEERYRSLFQNNHTVMLLIDPETGGIMDANPAASTYYGFSRKELLAKNITDINLLPPDQVFQEMERAKTEKRKRFEFRHRLASGEIRDVEVFSGPIRVKGKDLLYSIVHDVTARKGAEGALRESEKKYRSLNQEFQAILNAIPDILCLISPDLKIVWGNESTGLCAPTGLAGALGQHCHQLRYGQAEPCEDCPVIRCFHSGKLETEEKTAHGRFWELRAVPLYDDYGELLGAVEVARNITGRKRMEEALRQSEAKFRQVVESSPLPIALCTTAGMIEYVNPKFVETFGYTLEDVTQLSDWFSLAYPDPAYRQSLLSRWQESLERFSLENQPTEVVEVEITCKDGSKRIMQIFGTVVGETILTVFNDLTERKRMEEALEKRLVALSRPLDDAADISFHDLFNLEDMQRIQDLFAKSTGVASLITAPDGTPITQPSNFCRLCRDFIRQTELGLEKCSASDALLGRYNPDAPTMRHCLSAGLCGAGASITVGGKHIANWVIGQVRDVTVDEESLRDYARALGVDAEEFIVAFREVPTMSADQFQQVAQALFVLANQLSAMAYQNVQQARFITERKRMEEALRNSERRLSDIIDFLPDATFAIDLSGKVITWNRAIEEMTGVKAEAIIGQGDYAYALPFYGVRRPILIDLVTLSDEEIEKKYVFVQRQGDILLAEAHVPVRGENRLLWGKARALYNSEGQIIGALETIRDITEHKQAEEALRESEARFRQVVESSPLPIGIAVEGGMIEYVNPKFVETFGYTLEDIPQLEDWYRLAYPDPAYRQKNIAHWQTAIGIASQERRTTGIIEVEVTCKDGSQKIVDIFGTLMGHRTLAVFTDLTERKRAEEERARLEEQMREFQKLESLGLLAGGIAHDFNNLLMAILGNADLALLSLSPASPARPNVEEIALASQRAAELCRQMLAYSGKGHFVVGRHDLSEIVQEMVQILEVSVSKKASLRYSFAADLPAVEVDATQMRQIIMNLITNASEAIEEVGGVISISTGVMDCDRARLSESHLDDQLPEGRYVYLEVADTGCGMDEETRRRIFDPFFTTKFTGRGLGLAAVLGIVRGHRGAIKVYSEPGKGTTFTILLPAVSWEAGDRAQKTARAAAPQHQGTILLIDDDPHVRRVAGEMLGRLGLRVLTARQGQEGLEVFRAKGGEIDCVLLDLTMPGMGGEEAFQEMRRLRRDVRVVLSSGYDEQDATQQFVGQGLAGFIQKPYTVAKLQEVLNRVLSQRNNARRQK